MRGETLANFDAIGLKYCSSPSPHLSYDRWFFPRGYFLLLSTGYYLNCYLTLSVFLNAQEGRVWPVFDSSLTYFLIFVHRHLSSPELYPSPVLVSVASCLHASL